MQHLGVFIILVTFMYIIYFWKGDEDRYPLYTPLGAAIIIQIVLEILAFGLHLAITGHF